MNKLEFAKALREPDAAAVKRLTDHFEAQTDLYTTCRYCGVHLSGTLEKIKAHVCNLDILCSP